MPNAEKVNPKKWTNKIILYDDNEYSVCWGNYDNNSNPSLGVRWNDGYPSQGGNPLWYVEPEFTTEGILLSIIKKLCAENIPNSQTYMSNTLKVLNQLQSKKQMVK